MKSACYTMPRGIGRVTVKRRGEFAPAAFGTVPEIVAVDKFTECHVTPPDVAARMVRYADLQSDLPTLEPSAGTGNLTRALLAAGCNPERIVQVERHIRLSQGLPETGQVVNRCFLEYAAEIEGLAIFARVIMNPPFSDVRKHVAAALGLLQPGGVLVALVPVTFRHDAAEELETLPADTFATAKVYTKIIRIEK